MKLIYRSFACMLITLLTSPAEAAFELISNGSFSSGLTGWTVTNQAGGDGTWYSDAVGSTTPLNTYVTSSINLLGAAAAGDYAVSDQSGPGTHALEQSFIVPGAASSVILSFDMFVNNYGGGPVIHPSGLDYTKKPNEHGRVDILSAGSAAFDTGTGVLANYFMGGAPGGIPNPFKHFSFDITGLVGAGGMFDLRFAEVDNISNFNMGIDNVSVMFTAASAAVPEATSVVVWSLLGLIGTCVCWQYRVRAV